MREIKFRVFDGKQFSYFVIGQPLGGWALSVYDDYCINGREFQQYTGKILHGIPVYEGDIIEFDRKEWGGDDNKFVVEWDNDESAWSFGGGGGKSDDDWRKVIGNIYQNPELL